MSTKGSWQRPYDDKAWANGFERTFGKKVEPITVTVPSDLPKAPEPETTDDQAP